MLPRYHGEIDLSEYSARIEITPINTSSEVYYHTITNELYEEGLEDNEEATQIILTWLVDGRDTTDSGKLYFSISFVKPDDDEFLIHRTIQDFVIINPGTVMGDDVGDIPPPAWEVAFSEIKEKLDAATELLEEALDLPANLENSETLAKLDEDDSGRLTFNGELVSSDEITLEDLGGEAIANKGQANGYAPLNSSSKIDNQYLTLPTLNSLGGEAAANKGQANGYVPLNGSSKIASQYIDFPSLGDLGGEASANKSTDIVTDGASDTKYPTAKAVKDYADGLVVSALDYRGVYDASGNSYPTSGGSGVSGAVKAQDMWCVSVAGTLGGSAIQVGDFIIAAEDAPGQTASKWNTLNKNIAFTPEDVANKETTLSNSNTNYPTGSAVTAALGGYVPTSRTINGSALSSNVTLKASDISSDIISYSGTLTTNTVYSASFNSASNPTFSFPTPSSTGIDNFIRIYADITGALDPTWGDNVVFFGGTEPTWATGQWIIQAIWHNAASKWGVGAVKVG